MDWHQLPAVMRERTQWVCANDKKEPINARTGELAEVDDPSTWSTFNQACKAAIANGYEIGYVLSIDDELTIIDLDDKPTNPAPEAMKKVHADILANADTYIERSVSGRGYHVVVAGQVERPIKTPHIEQYSEKRFMICTGDVVKDLPVVNGQPLIDLIHQHFGSQSTYVDPLGELPDQAPDLAELPDEEIIRRGLEAENGDKFEALFNGDIDTYSQGDHSRADSALLNLLCFLTPHNEQVRRIFKASKLYRPNQRNRASNRYLNYSIMKWRAENPPLDMSQFNLAQPEQHGGHRSVGACAVHPRPMDEFVEMGLDAIKDKESKGQPKVEIPKAPPKQIPPPAPRDPFAEYPAGIIGELARFAFHNSYLPIPEACLAASISYVAGLVGRGFHINGLGLNHYMVFIADSGIGKEGGKRGIRAVHAKVVEKVPASQHNLGSADFSAGISMVKELAENPSMLGIAGEIGLTLKTMLDKRAPGHLVDLKRALTDAWSESGPTGLLNSRKYSDRSKNFSDVKRPCLSLLGESVPSHFYGALNDDVASDGFIPRWVIVEYFGERPDPNRFRQKTPPDGLIDRMADLYVASKTIQDSNAMVEVELDGEALEYSHYFENRVTQRIRTLPREHPIKAILSRTNEKSLKLAALLAVCENPHSPKITKDQMVWATAFIEKADGHMIVKYEDGSIGDDESLFEAMTRAAIRHYITLTPDQKIAAKCPKCLLNSPAIPHAFFKDYLKRKAAIKNHRLGMNKAIDICIADSIIVGILVKMPPSEKRTIGMRGGEAYLLGDGW